MGVLERHSLTGGSFARWVQVMSRPGDTVVTTSKTPQIPQALALAQDPVHTTNNSYRAGITHHDACASTGLP